MFSRGARARASLGWGLFLGTFELFLGTFGYIYSWALLSYSWALLVVYSWALRLVFLRRLSGGEEHEVAGYDEGRESTKGGFHAAVR